MKIIKAIYGDVDVSNIVSSKIKNNKLYFIVSNYLFGDTKVGHEKYLETEIELNGIIFTNKTKEHNIFTFPRLTFDRLGIFYSNNNDDRIRPCILASLKSIEKAAAGKADIITNMWNSEPENPFIETIAHTKISSHLNQILQILQLLYTAKNIKNYRYVSFLEHDVLYSESYFDYPDFEENAIYNLNYIGMNVNGFQKLIQKDLATSQIIMKFDYAINHFSNILQNALITNNGNLEPRNNIKELNTMHPNVHVNHGRHFTSHFNVYSKTDIETLHPYWGDHNQYKHLFF